MTNTWEQHPAKLREALKHLRGVRNFLVAQGLAPQTLVKLRSTIKSLEGAIRHADLGPVRRERQAKMRPCGHYTGSVEGDCPTCTREEAARETRLDRLEQLERAAMNPPGT